MKRIVYVQDSGVVAIVAAAPKKTLELVLGPLTDEEYEAHVIERSIPKGKAWRFIDETDVPNSREFRNAWVDEVPGSQIDIDLVKAKEQQLGKLRDERNKKLDESDKEFTRALEIGDQAELDKVKAKRQALRDATEPLKALQPSGYNDPVVLDLIRTLGKLT